MGFGIQARKESTTSISSVGAGVSLVVAPSSVKSLIAGTGIGIVNNGNDVTISNTNTFTGYTSVANYSALPAAAAHNTETYEVLASQGTSWLPGSLGGTYYSSGFYYSNGVSWSYLGSAPYQASQADVNTGTITDQFVSPSTLKNITSTIPGLTAGTVTTNANLTGDVTSVGNSTTLATVNGNVGSFTNASITVNAKGLITAASSGSAPEVPLTFSTGLTRTVNTVTSNLSTGVSGGQSVIGGTEVGDGLTYKSTTGNGTASAAAHTFVGGNNGATTALTLLNNGNATFGGTINNITFTTPATAATLTLANNTTTSVTGGGTLALGGFTATVPATGTVTLGSPGASGRVFVGTSANVGAGSSALTYSSNELRNTVSTNGSIIIQNINTNAGAASASLIGTGNGTYQFYLVQLGTGYTTAGLLVANLSYVTSSSTVGTMFINASASTKFWWTIGGSATTNEAMRLVSGGQLSIGTQADPIAVLNLKAGTTTIPQIQLASGVLTTTPLAFTYENDGSNLYATCGSVRGSLPRVFFTQTADQTVTNTTTETTLLGSGVGTKTLPANSLITGRTIRIRVGGVYSTPITGASATIKVKYGSTVLATVTTTSLFSNASNLEFDGEVLITCRTTGATGTVMTHGDIEYATGVTGTIAVDPLNNAGATTTIDTTASSALDVTITWDSNTTSRIAKSTSSTIEVLN